MLVGMVVFFDVTILKAGRHVGTPGARFRALMAYTPEQYKGACLNQGGLYFSA